MITRFDHAVIAVRDLDEAMRTYARLGFAVSRGGRHPGHGTENAIIRFGLDYLELLTVTDEQQARAQGLNRAALADFLSERAGGLVGYALASDDIDADAARLRAFGQAVEGPFPMQRQRPDGTTLAWQLTVPGGVAWRRPWPFLIHWQTPDAERLAREQPGTQPNGTTGVMGVSVVVRDLDGAIALYRDGLGLALVSRDISDGLAAERATFAAGGTRIELLAPRGEGAVSQALAANGEGVFSVLLTTPDLSASQRNLEGVGVPTSAIAWRSDELLVAPEAALGARLLLRASQP